MDRWLTTLARSARPLRRSLELGLSPDNPSPSGAIQRVVQGFAIHRQS